MTTDGAIKQRSRQPHYRIRWNYIEPITDYLFVDCEDFREALSAHLDGEEGAAGARQPVDAHLEHCGDCACWYDTAAEITRRVRTTAAVVWPDVSDAVLARVRPANPRCGPVPNPPSRRERRHT
jgi:hypothetical protein